MSSSRRRSMIAAATLGLAVAVSCAHGEDAVPPTDTELLDTLREAESNHDLGIELLESRPDEARAAFALAAAGFESVLDGGVRNADLHYNLANALLRAGDRGGSIVEYLRARALDPADPEIASNLAFARSQVPGRPTANGDSSIADRLATWWHVAPLRTRAIVAISLWTLFWLLLALRELPRLAPSRARRNTWPVLLGTTLAASLVLGTTVAIDLRGLHVSDRAVVVADEAILRKGNGDGFAAQSTTPLASGLECRVIEQRPGWARIALDDGRSGWLPSPSVELVSDSSG